MYNRPGQSRVCCLPPFPSMVFFLGFVFSTFFCIFSYFPSLAQARQFWCTLLFSVTPVMLFSLRPFVYLVEEAYCFLECQPRLGGLRASE